LQECDSILPNRKHAVLDFRKEKKLAAQKAGGRYEGKPFNGNMVL